MQIGVEGVYCWNRYF